MANVAKKPLYKIEFDKTLLWNATLIGPSPSDNTTVFYDSYKTEQGLVKAITKGGGRVK